MVRATWRTWRVLRGVLSSLGVLWLLVLLLAPHVCGVALGHGDSSKFEAAAIEQEYRCRTCVALATLFREDVMLPAVGGLHTLSSQTGRKDSDAVRAGARQRLVVKMHDAVDGLCRRVHEIHRVETNRLGFVTAETDSTEEKGKQLRLHEDDLFGSRRAVRDAVDALCDAVLEEVNEPLAQRAFAALLPASKKSDEESWTEGKETHQLGEAGAFCEHQRICTPSAVQSIVQEEEMRRQAIERLAKKQETGEKQQHFLSFESWGASNVTLMVPVILLVMLTSGFLLRRRRKGKTAAMYDGHTKSE
ncbi:hypothetical protein TCDM_13639 [Trypanosoma cruzi Dm28c]|uniref:DUF3456 domain-containing protein n=2 Tax=Trypanosoma cruzi TaxID=5693 RepID=V5AMN3_TRYCR|nr:hypothetical protein TCDM_13639 [Trypanosoma cruzi Dm28c]PWU91276.1 hypothetical protein C4B63_44g181 [Trypanosoma cruzi]